MIESFKHLEQIAHDKDLAEVFLESDEQEHAVPREHILEALRKRRAVMRDCVERGKNGGQSMGKSVARRRPLVVVLEDIHWAEPTFLDLLEYLAGWTRDAPILLLCLARPELLDDRPGWLTGPNVSGFVLGPLTDDESKQLLDELAQEWPLDQAARMRIAEGAEGNPLYVEQMAAMLAEQGADVAETIPPSIHALPRSSSQRCSTASSCSGRWSRTR